jgi:hypothetical protein
LPEKIIIVIKNTFVVMLKYYFFLVTGIFLVTGLMFSYVSEFYKVHAFSIGGSGGASTPQPSFGGSPQISSGKASPPQPSFGGSPQISSGSTIKQPNCVSQGSCTGTNDATNLKPTTNAESKNSVQTGPVTVKPNQGGSANINSNPKVVTNPNTAVVTNLDVAVNQNNVDVNVDGNSDADSNNDGNDETNNYYYSSQPTTEQTTNYYYQQETNNANGQNSKSDTGNENPQVIYNNSIINPIMPVMNLVGADSGSNTISGIVEGKAGQTLDLIGTSNKNYVQIKSDSNVTLSQQEMTLGQDDSLTLTFNEATGKWIETTHTDNSN